MAEGTRSSKKLTFLKQNVQLWADLGSILRLRSKHISSKQQQTQTPKFRRARKQTKCSIATKSSRTVEEAMLASELLGRPGVPISGRSKHVSDDNSEFHRLLEPGNFDQRTATWGPSLAAPILTYYVSYSRLQRSFEEGFYSRRLAERPLGAADLKGWRPVPPAPLQRLQAVGQWK